MINMKNVEIKAVHNKKLKKYLESIGELNKIMNGNVKCFCCNEIVNLDNLRCIIPTKNKKVTYCCSKLNCYQNMFEKGE